MVVLPSQPLAEIDPEFEKIALETGQFTYGLAGASTREKLLLCVANDICRQHLGLALRLHVEAALAHGVPFADLLAVVRFMGPYAGYPACADALARLAAIGTELGVDVRGVATAADQGDAPEPSRHRVQPGEDIGIADPWLAGFVASRTGRSWALPGLTDRERAYLALTADVARQTLGAAFRRHVQLAGDSGATPDEVRDVVRFMAEFGIGATAAALRELDSILDGGAGAPRTRC
jgi:4-carboxymuconolactone decarboxylase